MTPYFFNVLKASESIIHFRAEDLYLEFRINRCKIRLVENQTQQDAANRERLMTVKDYNIKENNVIAMVRNNSLVNSTSISYDEFDTTETDPLKSEREGAEIYHLVKPGDENIDKGRNRPRSIVDDNTLNQVVNGQFLLGTTAFDWHHLN